MPRKKIVGDEDIKHIVEERRCAKCGKIFIPAVYHIYKTSTKWYCSWTCYNHRDEGIDDLKPKKKVEIKCTTCQDYAFCDFDKILHHHRSGTPCKDYKERK